MAPQSETDMLIRSQQNLFTQIKRSHQLFLGQLYVTLLIMPLFAIFFLLFIPYLPIRSISLFSPLIGLIIVPIIGAIFVTKRSVSFSRSSASYFNQIEQTPESPQFVIGLTSYVNQLVYLLQPKALLAEKPLETLTEGLERLEKRLQMQIYLEIATIGGLGMFVFNIQLFFMALDPSISIHPLFYIVLGCLIAVFAIRLWLSLRWRQLAKPWILGFQELFKWGENLERLFIQQTEGGRSP